MSVATWPEAQRVLYRVAYAVGRIGLMATRFRFRAVRVVVLHGDEVLLVRHTYSRRSTWLVPGGGLKRSENPAVAAAREVKEEIGLVVSVTPLGTVETIEDGVKARTAGFLASVTTKELVVDPIELAEARWFPLNALPAELSDATAALIQKALPEFTA